MSDGRNVPSLRPLLILVAAAVIGAGAWLLLRHDDRGPREPVVAVIPKGTTHEFWKSIHAGAVKAERELRAAGTPVQLVWKGPLKEDDRSDQIDVVNTFVAQRVAGMVLAPLDSTALVAPVEAAADAGVPVVIIDSGIGTKRIASFVATDNRAGGRLGGERLASVLGGQGKVLLLRYQVGSASTESREAGFLEAIAAHPGITVVSQDQYAGPTRETALTAAQNLLNRYGREIQGVFTPNESSTAGMILALREAGLTGSVKHVGFDASEPLVAALKAGAVQGLVVQDPFDMGYKGVTFLAKRLHGETVPAQVDTNLALVTPENLADPAMRDLLHPPLERYLQ